MDKMDRTARLSVKKETPTLTPNEGDRPSGKPTSFQLGQYTCFSLPLNVTSLFSKRSTVPEIVEIRDEDEVDEPPTSGMYKEQPSDLPTSQTSISVVREEESPPSSKSELCIDEGRPPKPRQRRQELLKSSSTNVSCNKQELNHSAMVCNPSSDHRGINFHEKKLKFSFESDIRMGMLEAEARLKAGDFRKTEIYQGRATGFKFYIKQFLESPDYVSEECIPDGISKHLETDSLKGMIEITRDPRKAFAENNPKIPTTVFDCDHRNEWHALKENPSSSVGFSIIPGLNPELEALKGVERQVKSDQLAYKKEIPRKRKVPSDEQPNERKKPRTCEIYAAEQPGERNKPATSKTYAAEQPGKREKPATSYTYADKQLYERKKSEISKTYPAEQASERKKPSTSNTYDAEHSSKKKPVTSKPYDAEQPGEKKKHSTSKKYDAEQFSEKKPVTSYTYDAEQPSERKNPTTSMTYTAEQLSERKKPRTSMTYTAEQLSEKEKPATSYTYADKQPYERKKPGTSMTYTAELNVGNFPKASKTSTNGKKPRRKRCILNRPTINPNELSKVSIMIKNSLKQKISTSLNSIPESIEVADKSSPSVDEESANTGLNIPLFDKLNIDC